MAALQSGDVWSALSRIDFAVRLIREWTPSIGSVSEALRVAFARAKSREAGELEGDENENPRWILRASLPVGPKANDQLPAWTRGRPALSPNADLALRKYLASRLIAAWMAFLGHDLRTVAKYLRLCLDTVVLFQAARSRDEPETERWRESIRSADLWLLHNCDPERIAHNLR